jgi:hypothetical protein
VKPPPPTDTTSSGACGGASPSIASADVVEHEHLAGGPRRVGLHARAVVVGLAMAGGVDRERQRPQPGRPEDHGGRHGGAGHAQVGRQQQAGEHEQPADRQHGRADGQQGHEHEAGPERADERAGGRPGGDAADDRAARAQVVQSQSRDRRRDGAEHGGRGHQRQQRDAERRRVVPASCARAQRPHERDDQQRQQPTADQQADEQPMGVQAVGEPAPDRRAGRDPGERSADDRRRGLERQSDVGREQSHRQDLQHEHRAGCEEHDRRAHERSEAQRGAGWSGRRGLGRHVREGTGRTGPRRG